jgi:hypothetical protein
MEEQGLNELIIELKKIGFRENEHSRHIIVGTPTIEHEDFHYEGEWSDFEASLIAAIELLECEHCDYHLTRSRLKSRLPYAILRVQCLS